MAKITHFHRHKFIVLQEDNLNIICFSSLRLFHKSQRLFYISIDMAARNGLHGKCQL